MMGFWSSIFFYRPGPAPRVSTVELGAFIRDLAATGALRDQLEPVPSGFSWHISRLKFGDQVDLDIDPSVSEVPVPGCPGAYTYEDIEWDVEAKALSNNELAEQLLGSARPVYRASVSLCQLRRDISDRLDWQCEIGEQKYRLGFYDVHLSIEPVSYFDDDTDDEHMLGWMRLSMGGYGYFHPWKANECIQRVRSIPEIEAMAEVCRRFWPVEAKPPDEPTRVIREIMSKTRAWPYASVDEPLDWCWGASGCGA